MSHIPLNILKRGKPRGDNDKGFLVILSMEPTEESVQIQWLAVGLQVRGNVPEGKVMQRKSFCSSFTFQIKAEDGRY